MHNAIEYSITEESDVIFLKQQQRWGSVDQKLRISCEVIITLTCVIRWLAKYGAQIKIFKIYNMH